MSTGIGATANVADVADILDTWYGDPVCCIEDSFRSDPYGNPVKLDPCQKEILEAVRDHNRVRVQSGRGVGKTATAAMLTYWWLATRRPGLVVASAGSWSHLTDKLWPEIGAWGRKWNLRDGFEFQVLGIYSKDDPDTWRAESASSDKAVNVEGFHSPNLLIIIDEAKGMPDDIYSALIGSLSGLTEMGEQKCVALSTPPTTDIGWFAKGGEQSRWHTVHVSGLDSPRVSREYVEEIAEDFGENSPEYFAYVLGVIPEGVTGQLIRAAWFKAAQELGEDPKDRRPPVITCDVARFGEDLCTIGVIRRRKFNLVKFPEQGELKPRWGWFPETDLMYVVKRIHQAVRLHRAKAVCVDDTGLGGGVTDRLREMQHEKAFPGDVSIIPINFGAKAKRPDRFHLRKHEMWWQAREAIRIGKNRPKPKIALPTDEEIREWRLPKGIDFRAQFVGTLYESDVRERVHVYDKRMTGKELTKALPTRSADLAHAFILGVDYYQRQDAVEEPPKPPTNQEEALRRMMKEAIDKITRPSIRNPYRR